MIPTSRPCSTTTRAPTSLCAISAIASNTVASGPIAQTSALLRSRMDATVSTTALFMGTFLPLNRCTRQAKLRDGGVATVRFQTGERPALATLSPSYPEFVVERAQTEAQHGGCPALVIVGAPTGIRSTSPVDCCNHVAQFADVAGPWYSTPVTNPSACRKVVPVWLDTTRARWCIIRRSGRSCAMRRRGLVAATSLGALVAVMIDRKS